MKTQVGEKWKPVVGYEGLYEVSNLGRVKVRRRELVDSMGRHTVISERIVKIQISKSTGYPYVGLTKDGKRKNQNTHRMIAEAFLPNTYNFPCVNHIDEDRCNSVLSNLEWCTYEYNRNYNKNKVKLRKGWYANREERKRSIFQYTIDGKLVHIYDMWPSEFMDIYGLKIQGCLNHNKATAGGYVWRYENDPFSYNVQEYHWPQKIVEMYDKDNNLVRTFNGVTKMLKELRTSKQTFNGSKDENGMFHFKGYTFKKN